MGILALACLAANTVHENAIWAHPETLFVRDMRSAPEAPRARGAFAHRLLHQGKPGLAWRRFQVILFRSAAYESDCLGAAACLEALGHRDQALDVLNRAVEVFPHSNRCLIPTAHLAFVQGERDFAETLIRRVLAQSQRPWMYDIQLAVVLDRIGRPEEAERLLKETVARGVEVTEVWMALGTVLARQGKLEAAQDAYRHALALDPGLETARRKLAALQQAARPGTP